MLHLALPAPVLQVLQVWSKSVFSEGHFTLEVETLSLPDLTLHFRQVTETSKLIMPTHALEAGQLWLRSVGKQGHFTLQGETVFRP
jgi:hypothetical protein